jgi:beta-lactamase regulating signal transducer with metallopeptidase domain
MKTLLVVALSNVAGTAILALGVALVVRVVRRPALAHGLWLIVLLKLVVPGYVTFPSPLRGEAPPPLTSARGTASDPVVPSDRASQVLSPPPPVRLAPRSTPEPHREAFWKALGDRYRLAEFIPAFWLAGSVMWTLLAIVRISRFRRLLQHAHPAPTALSEDLQDLGRRMGAFPRGGLWLLPGAFPPMLWAIGGPARILVPEDLFPALSPSQRSSLLAHELAHLKRRDHWVRLLELVVTGLYWWCPLVWWVRRELRKAEEECCDAWVVWALPQGATDYAEALVETTGFLSNVRPVLPPAMSGVGYAGELKRRITMIMSGDAPRNTSVPARVLILGLAFLLPFVPALAQNDPQPPASPSAAQDGKTPPRPDLIEAHYYYEKASEQLKLDQEILRKTKLIAGKEGVPSRILQEAESTVEKDKSGLEAARLRLAALGGEFLLAPAKPDQKAALSAADEHYRVAEHHFQKGDFATSEKECRRALDAYGPHLPARALLDELIFLQSGRSKPSAPPPSVTAPRIPLIGKITAVATEIGLVIISIGKDDGVVEGDELTIQRAGEFVAKILIDRLDRKWSAGKVFQKKSDPLVADDVTNHLSFSAPRTVVDPTPTPAPAVNRSLRVIERVQPTMVPMSPPAALLPGLSPQDQVDLLKARLEVHKAKVTEAELALQQARTGLARTEQMAKSGLASETELVRGRNEVESLAAQLEIRRAEFREAELMVTQARRALGDGLKPR